MQEKIGRPLVKMVSRSRRSSKIKDTPTPQKGIGVFIARLSIREFRS